MREKTFERLMNVRKRLLELEADHPESPKLKALHDALMAALSSFGAILTQGQYQTLSGGGPNKPPPDDGGG